MGSIFHHTQKTTIIDDFGVDKQLRVDHNQNLRTGFPFGLKSVSVTTPGTAYANGVNALCLVRPVELDQVRIVTIHLSCTAAGAFYLAVRNLGTAPGATTAYTFDLAGMRGDGLPTTSDVIWGGFTAVTDRHITAGGFHFDCGVGNEVFLIAPNDTYNFMLTWTEEIAEA